MLHDPAAAEPQRRIGLTEIVEREALVVRVDFGSCQLRFDGGEFLEAGVRGKLMGRKKALGNAVVVGDRVTISEESGQYIVESVAPRRNFFSRRAAGNEPLEQVVATNLDQVVLVASIVDPDFKAGLADRVLCQAEHCGVSARLVLNKADLATAAQAAAIAGAYRSAGYEVHVTCAQSGLGVDELRAACEGHRSLLVGHSGVGKSTLMNALAPGIALLEGHVNAKTGKGRHTTTAAWLLEPSPGLELIDTPGVRAFGLWGIGPRDLDQAYVEFQAHLGNCRFGDCTHRAEPGCALREAVKTGAVARLRFESYLKLRDEIEQEQNLQGPRRGGRL